MADNSELEFRRFKPEDIESLRKTFELCFGAKPSDRYFQWKYFDNPAGEVVAFVAAHDNTIAAFYGVIPEYYVVNGEVKKIHQSMDTMTHPNYQRRGLFVKLANLTYDLVQENEGDLKVIGVGGPTSYGGLVKKLKWKDVNKFKYIFTNKYLFKAANLLSRGKNLEITKTTEINQDLADFLKNRKLSAKPIQPHVSPEFFNWRVLGSADRKFQALEIKDKGETVGICVYVMDEKERCLIHFLNFSEERLFGDYTSAVIQHLFNETGAQFVFTWEPLNQTFHKALQKAGFLTNPMDKGPFSYQIPFVVRVEPETSDGTSWINPDNYDIQPLMQD